MATKVTCRDDECIHHNEDNTCAKEEITIDECYECETREIE